MASLRDYKRAYEVLVCLGSSSQQQTLATNLKKAMDRGDSADIRAATTCAEAELKDFNPDEPRDWHGRWGHGGGGLPSTTGVGRKPRFWPERGEWAIRRLRAENPPGLHVEDERSDKVQSAVYDYYRLPAPVRHEIEENARLSRRDAIHVNDRTLLDFPDFAATVDPGGQPRGWTKGSSWKNPRGVYSSRTGMVFVAGDGTSDGSRSVMIHEIGHMIQRTLEMRSDLAPNFLQQLQDFHRSLYDHLTPYEQQDGPGSTAGSEEFFAESLAEIVVADSYPKDAPARQKAVERFGKAYVDWAHKMMRAYSKGLQ